MNTSDCGMQADIENARSAQREEFCADLCMRELDDGVALFVRATPKGGRDAIDGIVRDANGKNYLAVRIAAPPSDGAANKAIQKYLAKLIGVPKSAVKLLRGETARFKQLHISCNRETLVTRLEAAMKR